MEPPACLTEALEGIARPHEPVLRWAHPDHITIRFWNAVELPEVARRAACAAATVQASTATAGPGTAVLGGRVLVVPVRGLEELALALGGEQRAGRPFVGHLTLARARGARRIQPGVLPLDVPPACSWRVDSIAAYRSELHPEGAVHHLLGRWTLGGG